jgi:chaperonin GroES
MPRTVLRPGPGRIAVEPIDPSQEYKVPGTDLRLWIPTSATHEGLIGRVVAVSAPYQSDAGVEFDSNYKIGDLVIVGKFTGTKVNIGRETYTVLFEKDVLASIETEEGDDAQEV